MFKRSASTNDHGHELRNAKSAVIASHVVIADDLATRTKGLLGRTEFPEGEALWIKRCNSIHTFFMRFPIDAIFVDKNLNVVSMHHALPAWRITMPRLSATSVFELPAGTLEKFAKANEAIEVGDRLNVAKTELRRASQSQTVDRTETGASADAGAATSLPKGGVHA